MTDAFFTFWESVRKVFIFILGISYVITTVTSISSLISGSSCIYIFCHPLSCLIQTELSLINIDYNVNPWIDNVKKWQNLTTGLETFQENFSIFIMQIALVCVTIWIEGLICAQLIEGKEGGSEWE